MSKYRTIIALLALAVYINSTAQIKLGRSAISAGAGNHATLGQSIIGISKQGSIVKAGIWYGLNPPYSTCVSAVRVVNFTQGPRKDSKQVGAERSDATKALGTADAFDKEDPYNFVSLGFGGSLVVELDNPLFDGVGMDLRVTETSTGNPFFRDYPEQAEVYVSKDGISFKYLGKTNPSNPTRCNQLLDSDFDLTGIVNWCRYVKLIDITNPLAKKRNVTTCVEGNVFAFNAAADGFDVDAVTCLTAAKPAITSARGEMTPTPHAEEAPTRKLSSMVAYPNPATNTVTIDLNNIEEFVVPEDGLLRIETFSITGAKINESTNAINEDFSTSLSLHGFPSGLLLVKITNAGTYKTIKIEKK